MSPESPPERPAPDYDYTVFYEEGTVYRHWNGGEVVMETYRDPVSPPASPVAFEHDKQKRLFILTWPDGKVEHFRDNPARHLIVAPDPETGEMRPVIKHGRPAYLYCCREERELT